MVVYTSLAKLSPVFDSVAAFSFWFRPIYLCFHDFSRDMRELRAHFVHFLFERLWFFSRSMSCPASLNS